MKTTLSWIKTHLDTDAPVAEIVERLIMLGHDVEGVENRAAALEPFTIARVISAERHPNADRLKLCMVETAGGKVQVVCGAPNARTGMKGVFAPAGTVIPRTGAVLRESTIRGVASRGMLLSGYELALSEDHEGIIEVPEDAPVGARYADIIGLGDPVIDVKVTPNRADCLGVRGIARDLAAGGLGRLRPLDTTPVPGGFASPIAIRIEDRSACPLFLGRVVRGLRNGHSPKWLRERLEAIGLRPISALVDITNFLTFDVNRPLHVFDAGRLAGDLTVRFAHPGEMLLALNGQQYALDPEITAIADDNGVQSLGGVIGGEATGCTEATTAVLIEAALFDPVRTAATGRRLGIASDARYRFERGLDPEFVRDGIEIATRLILEFCGGEPSEIVTAGAVPEWRRQYVLRSGRVMGLGGLEVPQPESAAILDALGFAVEARGGDLAVASPPWRGAIVGEADLVEEVLRVGGYDRIPAVPLPRERTLTGAALAPAQRRAEHVRRTLAARGLVEAVTFSFVSSREAELFGGGRPELRLVNPISADLDAMRPSVVPGLVAAAKRNADRGFADAALFELGPAYRDDTPAGQVLVAAGIRAGHTGPKHWREPPREADLYLVKADALAALAAAGAPAANVQVAAEAPPWFHPGRSGTLRLGPKVLGHFGELHPLALSLLDARPPIAGFEVVLDAVPEPRAAGPYKPPLRLSVFQPIERDFAFVVDHGVPAEALLRAARAVDRQLIAEVRLFDVYEGAGLPDGTKSLAITVVLQPQEKTLTDAEIEGFSKRLVAAVEKATGGRLRG